MVPWSPLQDTRVNDEKRGAKNIVMFASRSIHKNRAAMEALDGKPESYIKEILDPSNVAFENTVATNRAGKIDPRKKML